MDTCAKLIAIIAVAPTTEPDERSMPPEMMTWVTPMAMMPTVETCRMMIVSRGTLKSVSTLGRVLNRKLSPMRRRPRISKAADDEQQRDKYVEFRRPRPFRGIILQAANTMGCLCHLHPPPMGALGARLPALNSC